MGAGIPTVSGLQTIVWIWFVMDFFAAATGFLRGMVPNDILAILAVAVTLGVVVASERIPSDPGQCDVCTDVPPDSRGVACGCARAIREPVVRRDSVPACVVSWGGSRASATRNPRYGSSVSRRESPRVCVLGPVCVCSGGG